MSVLKPEKCLGWNRWSHSTNRQVQWHLHIWWRGGDMEMTAILSLRLSDEQWPSRTLQPSESFTPHFTCPLLNLPPPQQPPLLLPLELLFSSQHWLPPLQLCFPLLLLQLLQFSIPLHPTPLLLLVPHHSHCLDHPLLLHYKVQLYSFIHVYVMPIFD